MPVMLVRRGRETRGCGRRVVDLNTSGILDRNIEELRKYCRRLNRGLKKHKNTLEVRLPNQMKRIDTPRLLGSTKLHVPPQSW